MNSDYLALKHLLTQPAYKLLEALWSLQVAKIEEARDKAAYRGSETAWRYYAGQEKGYKLAMMKIHLALAEMEKDEDASSQEGVTYEEIMENLKKGEQP